MGFTSNFDVVRAENFSFGGIFGIIKEKGDLKMKGFCMIGVVYLGLIILSGWENFVFVDLIYFFMCLIGSFAFKWPKKYSSWNEKNWFVKRKKK